jgi:hypothetical protein
MASTVPSSIEGCLRDLARGVSEHTYNEVTGLLGRMLDKIVSNPMDAKYRRVALSFPLLQKTIGAHYMLTPNCTCTLFSCVSVCAYVYVMPIYLCKSLLHSYGGVRMYVYAGAFV